MTHEEAGEVADELRTAGWVDEAAVLGELIDLAYITHGNLVTTGQMFARRWPIPSSLTMLEPFHFTSATRLMSFLLSVQAERVVRCWVERDLQGWGEANGFLLHLIRCTFFAVGLPFEPFWKETHRANMQKVPGKLRRKEQPSSWRAPDTGRILRNLRQHD